MLPMPVTSRDVKSRVAEARITEGDVKMVLGTVIYSLIAWAVIWGAAETLIRITERSVKR